jgi:hypothetical protein
VHRDAPVLKRRSTLQTALELRRLQAVTVADFACVCFAIFRAAAAATGRAFATDGAPAHTAAGITTQAMHAAATVSR